MAMTEGYYIGAISPSTQQINMVWSNFILVTQRRFDQAEFCAERLARAYAERLNQNSSIKDWQPRIEFKTLGGNVRPHLQNY